MQFPDFRSVDGRGCWPAQPFPVLPGRAPSHPETFLSVFVNGQERLSILPFEKPVFWAFQGVTQPWSPTILFGHERITPSYPESMPLAAGTSCSR
jgi:hypothetical protein